MSELKLDVILKNYSGALHARMTVSKTTGAHDIVYTIPYQSSSYPYSADEVSKIIVATLIGIIEEKYKDYSPSYYIKDGLYTINIMRKTAEKKIDMDGVEKYLEKFKTDKMDDIIPQHISEVIQTPASVSKPDDPYIIKA